MSTGGSKRLKLEDLVVVDCDIHINEPPGELAPYCDMPWRVALESLHDNVPHRYQDIPGYAPNISTYIEVIFPGGIQAGPHETENSISERLVADGKNGGGRKVVKEKLGRDPIVSTAGQLRGELDELLIDIGVCVPDNFLTIAALDNPDYAAALGRAYNRWMIDQWLSRVDGLKGLLLTVPQDPVDAAREIELLGNEEHVVGIMLPTAGVNPLWGNRKYDPIFEAAQAADLCCVFHGLTYIFPTFPNQLEQLQGLAPKHVLAHPFQMIANLVSLFSTGVPARFPNLKFLFTEAGIGYAPYMMWRLDKEYQERRREMPLAHRPTHYMKDRFFFSTQPIEEPDDPADLVSMIKLLKGGEDTVVFASDWPHHDFDNPAHVFGLPWPAELKRKVMGENALRLFNIPAPVKTKS